MQSVKFICTTLIPIFTFFSLAIGVLVRMKQEKFKKEKSPILVNPKEPLLWTEVNENSEIYF